MRNEYTMINNKTIQMFYYYNYIAMNDPTIFFILPDRGMQRLSI